MMKYLLRSGLICLTLFSLSAFADDFEAKVSLKPGQNNLTIHLKNSESTVQVDIYNIIGNLIETKKLPSQPEIKIDLKDLRDGVYFVKIHNQASEIYQKFTKN